jgi:hypothetical protein
VYFNKYKAFICVQSLLDNSAPILGGKNTLLAYVGKPSFMLFNATDVDSNVTNCKIETEKYKLKL